MATKWPWMVGGVAAVGILGWALMRPAPAQPPGATRKAPSSRPAHSNQQGNHSPSPAHPALTPSQPVPSGLSGFTATAPALGFSTPMGPVDVVANPANRHQLWAFVTEGQHNATTGQTTLWFGQAPAGGPWHWTPITLPSAIPKGVPNPVRAALTWANDLAQREPATTPLYGSVNWNTVTGTVGEPVGWTATEADGFLTITVWDPSLTQAGLYDGVRTEWTAATVNTPAGLWGLTPAAATSMAQIARANQT